MKFENLLSELETTVKALEKQETGLDESIALFNKGLEISKQCLAILDESKGKITVLKEELGKLNEVECDIQ
jgi:exodeoxyribonuclease VII small subunit